MLKYIITALLLYAAAGCDAGRTQNADAKQRAFVERYVAVLTSQDSDSVKRLFHPASLACINAENRDYYDVIFAKELSQGMKLRGGYTLTRFETLGPDAASAATIKGMIENPVQPTHEFQLDTPFDSMNSSLTLMRMVVEHDGAWSIVLGCPTAPAVAFFRERRAEGERQQARARQLASELPEPLRSEIRALLAQSRRIDAVKRYRVATNVDLTTATLVIDVLTNP
jgi:hypothetical protein